MNFPEHLRGRVAALWLVTLGAVVVLGVLGGCSTRNPYPVGSYDRAVFWGEQGRYQEAADAYEVFVRQNPTDSLAAQAQFEKALAYMQIKEYPLAAVEFQILTQDYPISELVEAARFHEGECYYFQVGRIERDVTPAYEARLHWLDFARQYPTSEHMPQIRQYMQDISDLLVLKRLRAVKVYEQLRHWDAVALGLDRILTEEPASGLIDEVLLKRGQVAERLDDPGTAGQMYRRLLDEYPDSALRDQAQAGLRRLAGDQDAPPDDET